MSGWPSFAGYRSPKEHIAAQLKAPRLRSNGFLQEDWTLPCKHFASAELQPHLKSLRFGRISIAPRPSRLTQLEDENNKLRKLVADPSLDREMLQNVIRRKL